MGLIIFLKSCASGFIMCVPLGPIGIVTIRKTIRCTKNAALVPGIGSVIADMLYGTITGFGIVMLADFFSHYQRYIQLAAASILLILSFKILRTDPKKLTHHEHYTPRSYLKSFLLGFSLALFNPSTLFFMTTLLTLFGVANYTHNMYTGVIILLGLACGELAWWFSLTRITAYAQNKIGARAPVTINKFSGIFLLILCVGVIIKSVFWP